MAAFNKVMEDEEEENEEETEEGEKLQEEEEDTDDELEMEEEVSWCNVYDQRQLSQGGASMEGREWLPGFKGVFSELLPLDYMPSINLYV